MKRAVSPPRSSWPTRETLRYATAACCAGVARGLALFLGAFSLLNLLGEFRRAGFDINTWWIDLRPLPTWLGQVALATFAFIILAYAMRPSLSRSRRAVTAGAVGAFMLVATWNASRAIHLMVLGRVHAGFPIPFSAFVGGGLLLILLALIRSDRPGPGRLQTASCVLAVAMCIVGFPLAQMLCFGKTDYRRNADAIIVFGARTYADGRPSDALIDRVRTGCRLYAEGWAGQLIFSGGSGDGAVHETEAMRNLAVSLSVPADRIRLDRGGINTQATVANTAPLLAEMGAGRALVVSHFYHLPRIKMAYARAGREVYTVPAKESYVLTAMPYFVAREIAALWAYYIRPLLP